MMILRKEEEMAEMIKDPRQAGKITHPLGNIVLISICAVICGADTWEEIADFGKKKKEWLAKFLKLPDGTTPSADTIARFFQVIKVKEFERYFLEWVKSITCEAQGDYIAIDGKTLRGSYDSTSEKAAIHMVSAWSALNGCVLGQVKTEEKSNEITAIPELLKVLEINNSVVTIDAMGTQKKIAAAIIKGGGDYILAVKSNQPKLEKDIVEYFNHVDLRTLDSHEEVEARHGRAEVRRYYISDDLERLSTKNEWPGLKAVGMTASQRLVKGVLSIQRKYYIVSISPDVMVFANGSRKHWGIENSLHWCLDVGFREDECRIRKGCAAENMAIVRHIALNMLKKEKTTKKGIARKRFNAAISDEYLELILKI
jgi:predicted transposase YbfD/YdcC